MPPCDGEALKQESDSSRFASCKGCIGFGFEDELEETRLEAGRALGI